MTDPAAEESELRLPAAYSQGFAHVRVVMAAPKEETLPLPLAAEPEMAAATDFGPDSATAPSG